MARIALIGVVLPVPFQDPSPPDLNCYQGPMLNHHGQSLLPAGVTHTHKILYSNIFNSYHSLLYNSTNIAFSNGITDSIFANWVSYYLNQL